MIVFEYRINKKKKGAGIKGMSIVNAPAIEVPFVKLSKEKVTSVNLSINKEQQIVTGPVMIPDIKIYRSAESLGLNEDGYIFFTKETIKKASQLFLENEMMNNTSLDHENKTQDLKLIESWIIVDKEKDKAAALGFNLPEGTWMCSYKVNNGELWEKIKAGEFTGFSIEADNLDRVEVEMAQEEESKEKFEWVLGDNTNHCPMCLEAQHYAAKTKEQWAASRFGTPRSGKTFCKENCTCTLEPQTQMNKEKLTVEPGPSENEGEFISRCIKVEMDNGHPQDQAIAICYSKWENKMSDEDLSHIYTLMQTQDLAEYPWDKCIADQKARGLSDESAAKVCGWIKSHYGGKKEDELSEDDIVNYLSEEFKKRKKKKC